MILHLHQLHLHHMEIFHTARRCAVELLHSHYLANLPDAELGVEVACQVDGNHGGVHALEWLFATRLGQPAVDELLFLAHHTEGLVEPF